MDMDIKLIKLSFRATALDIQALQAIEARAAPLKGFSPTFSALVSQAAAATPPIDWRQLQQEVQSFATPAAKGTVSSPLTLSVCEEDWTQVRQAICSALGLQRPRASYLIRMILLYGRMQSSQTPPPALEIPAEQLDGLQLVEHFVRILQSQDAADKAAIQEIATILKNHEGGPSNDP